MITAFMKKIISDNKILIYYCSPKIIGNVLIINMLYVFFGMK
jgi:hypothetical protein